MFKYFNDKRNHEFANQKEFCKKIFLSKKNFAI